MNRHHLSWATPIVVFLLSALIFLSLSRGLLMIWQIERVAAVDGFWYILLQGIRFDLVLLAQIIIIPIILVPLLSMHDLGKKFIQTVTRYYFLSFAGLLIFLELITPNFIGQYDFRPNMLMLEYLLYPKEVMSMLVKAVPFQLFLVSVITGILIWQFSTCLKFIESKTHKSIFWSAPLLIILGVILCISAARSTLGHRPVNPSTVAFSSDPLVNSLPLSSGYSVAYALYEKIKHEEKDTKPYGKLPESEILAEIYDAMNLARSDFTNADIPTLHHQQVSSSKQKNIVIVLEESLGADFVGKLGGTDTTPNLDQLSNEGMWFEQLYATGTRSVRGIEAVITGFLPTPARSVVKLGGSQHNFFTIAQLLKQKGYDTSFIYGGEAHFDNMKRFFVNNGFNTIIEEKDFTDPVFTGAWGVSDEDLFNKAHDTFTSLAKRNEPFFSLVFTSTNHSPFEFPDRRIELAEKPKNTVLNAVKYADFALGEFIDKAKNSNYWDNTIFLIVADHSDRVYGDELVPISKFRIPGLILAKDIKAKVVKRISSQIDLLPTLLSLAGIESSHPAIGVDITREDIATIPGRAIMQFGGSQAYMQGDQVVVFQKERSPLQFTYSDKKLSPSSLDLILMHQAKAHALWSIKTYRDKSYRLP